jgi:hypothetical protein
MLLCLLQIVAILTSKLVTDDLSGDLYLYLELELYTALDGAVSHSYKYQP